MATKKVKATGKYGSRYGVGIRRRLLEVEGKKKQDYYCSQCGFRKIKRKSRGIFECRKCGAEFTGGAYLPETLTGQIVRKMVSQKSFVPSMKELVEATEKSKHRNSLEKEEKEQERHAKPVGQKPSDEAPAEAKAEEATQPPVPLEPGEGKDDSQKGGL